VNKIEELDKLDRAIKEAEINLKSVQQNTEQMAKEIAALSPRKLELEQNIEFHKKSDTIPIIHEHRKAKAELSKTTARLILIRADHKRASEACKDIEFIIQKLKKDQEALLRISDDNVLRPTFGGNNGKK
jgi:hypothetical protein